jgi:glutamate racemase
MVILELLRSLASCVLSMRPTRFETPPARPTFPARLVQNRIPVLRWRALWTISPAGAGLRAICNAARFLKKGREPAPSIHHICATVPSQPAPRTIMAQTTILVFDSGLGGLTVFREIAAARPDAKLVFAADDAFFPYGGHGEAELVARVVPLIGDLIARFAPDLVVIACNTASTLVLPHLRARYAVPFVGTVPAIKPACAASKSKRVAVLGTEATVKREYTRALIRDFAQGCDVTLVGSATLASIAEAALREEPVEDAAIAAEIAPCFVNDGGRRTDTVVLACTHFPLLLDRLERLAPWRIAWIDPAPAIARRVVELLGPPQAGPPPEPAVALFTSARAVSPALVAALSGFGIKAIADTTAI